MCKSPTCLIVFASILGPLVLLFISLSFGTNYWLIFTVDRTKITPATLTAADQSPTLGQIYSSRNKGIFQECFPTNATKFMETIPAADKIDDFCLKILFDVKDSLVTTGFSDAFWSRFHLMRSQVAAFALAIVLFIAAYCCGIMVCCQQRSVWAKAAGLCAYGTAFTSAAALALFHATEYVEKNEIRDQPIFYANWDQELKDATTRRYGWSYIVGWVGMILSAITATLYIIAAWILSNNKYEDDDTKEKAPSRLHSERGYPAHIPMEPMYYPGDAYKYAMPRAGFVGPYGYDMESRRGQPVPVGYADPRDLYYWQ